MIVVDPFLFAWNAVCTCSGQDSDDDPCPACQVRHIINNRLPTGGGRIVKGKKLKNSDISGALSNVDDLVVVGNGDTFELLCKVYSEDEGWMKSTKAMEVPGGCVVQVTTQQRNPDGSYVIA